MLKRKINVFFRIFTWKRLFNSLLKYASYGLSIITGKAFVWGMPGVIMIEPTNICNLKCPMCPSGNGSLKRAKGYMEFDLYKKIIDEVSEYAFMVILWNQGEPFLNKDMVKMIKYAHSKRLYTLVSTNANIMPSAEDIVDSGLDRLIVSLDGASQETYNQYRINGEIDKVIENVKKLVAAKKKKNSIFPKILWQFIVMKHNEHEIEPIRKLAKELGVDSLSLKTVQIYEKDDIKNFLPENPKYRRYKISGDDFELKFGIKNRCRRIWDQPVINWNGEMAVCCFDKDIDFPVGNVRTNSVKSIFKNKKFQKMRNTILTDRKSIKMCRNCGEGVKLTFSEKSVNK